MRLLPMLHRGITQVAATTVLTLVALGPGIARAASWLNPIPLNTSTGSGQSVAMDGTGNTIAAWETNGSPDVVQGAFHAFGATGFKQLPDFANDSGLMTPLDNGNPVVVMNRGGNGLAVWIHFTGFMGNARVELRTISPGGVTSGRQFVSPANMALSHLSVAINDNGAAIIAWQRGNTIEAVTRSTLTGSFGPSTPTVLDSAATGPPSVAIDSSGHVLALWPHNGVDANLIYASTTAGAAWPASNSAISGAVGETFTEPSLAYNSAGRAVVAYQDSKGTTDVSEASGTISGGFGAPAALSGTISSLQGPGATVADSGAAIVGWATSSAVQYSRRPAGRSFPSPAGLQSITPVPVGPNSFTLSGDGRGDVIAAWYGFETSAMHNVVRAAVKPAGSNSFGPSQIISNKTTDMVGPVITMDRNGDGVVGMQIGNTPAGVSLAIYDASPPQLGKPSGPSSLKAGAKASFSASAVDAFSGVSKVSWNFGDGSGKTNGAAVSHVFAGPGRFTVKVTATDRAGNSSSATLTVNVTAPANRCVVPRLKGKTLSKAKSALKKAHCKLGKVTKPKKPKHRKLRKLVVKRSSPSAGKIKPVGTKVSLTLAEVPKKKHK